MAEVNRVPGGVEGPFGYKEKRFGASFREFDYIKANAKAYAAVFSEGSPGLERLLLQMWNHDVETIGCCRGHPNKIQAWLENVLGRRSWQGRAEDKMQERKPTSSFVDVKHGYFAFQVATEAESVGVASKLRQELAESYPMLPCRVFANRVSEGFVVNGVAIYFKRYLSNEKMESAFSDLADALCKVLDFDGMGRAPEVCLAGVQGRQTALEMGQEIDCLHLEANVELEDGALGLGVVDDLLAAAANASVCWNKEVVGKNEIDFEK